jgi:hypothetical protein
MGLDTTHECWHGAYSSFNLWREKLCEAAGLGNLRDYEGFSGDKQWPQLPIVALLNHSDCEGKIAWKDCKPIADALIELVPALKNADRGRIQVDYYVQKTERFIAGLLEAHENHESVEFH